MEGAIRAPCDSLRRDFNTRQDLSGTQVLRKKKIIMTKYLGAASPGCGEGGVLSRRDQMKPVEKHREEPVVGEKKGECRVPC